MANGLSDILSAYRQGLSSERQARQDEMQFALQAMQFESQQKFRDESLQREEVMGALEYAKEETQKALVMDTGEIYSKIASLAPIMGAGSDEETGGLLKTKVIINALTNEKGDYGFTENHATQIVNIANLYQMSAKNPNLALTAEKAAQSFAREVGRDYDKYPNSALMKSMKRSGLIYSGGDPLQLEMSSSPYLAVGDALAALDNIDKERMEIVEGDYKIDSPVTVSEVAQADLEALTDELNVAIGSKGGKETQTNVNIQSANLEAQDADILEELDFLDPNQTTDVRKKLRMLNEKIVNKQATLDIKTQEQQKFLDDYELFEEKYKWHRNQAKLARNLGDEESVLKHRKEADRYYKMRSPYALPNMPAGKEGWGSQAAREVYIKEQVEQHPGLYTKHGIQSRPIDKPGEWMGKVPRKAYESTRGVQILRLAEEIKELQRNKELLRSGQ
tara:strand:+ start:2071 stop:3414 length:1344 start_codon:yes stop_codon:yes gene_type:complete